jgi:hypothetical protein
MGRIHNLILKRRSKLLKSKRNHTTKIYVPKNNDFELTITGNNGKYCIEYVTSKKVLNVPIDDQPMDQTDNQTDNQLNDQSMDQTDNQTDNQLNDQVNSQLDYNYDDSSTEPELEPESNPNFVYQERDGGYIEDDSLLTVVYQERDGGYIEDDSLLTEGKCCFCREPCNPLSQSCGACARNINNFFN